MKRVVVFTTGGTIGMKQGPMVGGAVPSLKGEEFLALLPRDGIELTFQDFASLPGSHITPAHGLELARHVESALMAPDMDGVVVTHATDTLEETAYLLDLTINSPKPVVFAGSMRSASHLGYDGMVNLAAAIRLAAAPQARDLGVLVVSSEEIHAASQVQRIHTQAINAFQSPGSGPLGFIDEQQIWLNQRPLTRQYIPCSRLEETVDLIRITQGMDDRMLRHSIADRVGGLVIETLGSGHVPPWWLPALNEAVAQRISIVITSRCNAGSLGDEYGYVGSFHDLKRLGLMFSQNLPGIKARIKLMVALGAARSHDELRKWFQ